MSSNTIPMDENSQWNEEEYLDGMEGANDEEAEPQEQITLTMQHHGKPFTVALPTTSTMSDLASTIASSLSIPEQNQKYMVTPKVGTLKYPFPIDLPLSSLTTKKIVLLGTSTHDVATLQSHISALTARASRPRPVKSALPARTRDWKRTQDEAQYTFHALRPLAYLPRPERSLRFLERLRDDPGIKAAMRSHKFSVPLLTEMDPALHTTHQGKTLGLNRNKGEVIELRLRTDAYDGYRDYKTIRETLCHELAHNVHGPHDRKFFDLMKQIEDEVKKADWTRGGRSVGEEEFYNPDDGGPGEHVDEGGWTGGEFVLGGGSAIGTSSAGSGEPLTRREILARAAEERSRKAKSADSNSRTQESNGAP